MSPCMAPYAEKKLENHHQWMKNMGTTVQPLNIITFTYTKLFLHGKFNIHFHKTAVTNYYWHLITKAPKSHIDLEHFFNEQKTVLAENHIS